MAEDPNKKFEKLYDKFQKQIEKFQAEGKKIVGFREKLDFLIESLNDPKKIAGIDTKDAEELLDSIFDSSKPKKFFELLLNKSEKLSSYKDEIFKKEKEIAELERERVEYVSDLAYAQKEIISQLTSVKRIGNEVVWALQGQTEQLKEQLQYNIKGEAHGQRILTQMRQLSKLSLPTFELPEASQLASTAEELSKKLMVTGMTDNLRKEFKRLDKDVKEAFDTSAGHAESYAKSIQKNLQENVQFGIGLDKNLGTMTASLEQAKSNLSKRNQIQSKKDSGEQLTEEEEKILNLDASSLEKEIIKLQNKIKSKVKKGGGLTRLMGDIADLEEDLGKIEGDSVEKLLERDKIIKQILSKANELEDASANENNYNKKATLEQIKYARSLAEGVAERAQGLVLDQKSLINSKLLTKAYKEHGQAIRAAQMAMEGTVGVLEKMVSIIPPGLQSFLGIDKALEGIKGQAEKAVQTFAEELAKGGSKMEALTAATRVFGKSLWAALGPIGIAAIAIGGLFLLVKGIVDLVKHYQERWEEISKETGLSLSQAKQLHKQTLAMVNSTENKLLLEKDILELQSEYIKQNGVALDLSKKQNREFINSLGETASLFGYSNEEAMQLHTILRNAGMNDKVAANMQKTAALAAEAAGIAPSIITKDLIEGADVVATYYSRYPKQAAAAAIQTRKLGMSLKQAGAIADKMLDIDSFMTDMFELSAMTRGGIDLSKAFDLRMSGADPAEVAAATLDAVGTLSDFNRQDEFTKRKLADTLGMTTSELQNSLRLREMGLGQDAKAQKAMEALLATGEDLDSISKEQIENKKKELETGKQFDAQMSKLGTILQEALLPLMEALNGSMGAIVGAVKFFGELLKGIVKPLVWISQLFGSTQHSADNLAGSAGEVADKVEDTWTFAKGLGVALGAIAAFWVGGKIFKGTLGAFKMMKGMTTSIADGIKMTVDGAKNLPNIFSKLKESGGGFIDKIKGVFGKSPTEAVQDKVKDTVSGTIEDKVKGKADELIDKTQESVGESGKAFKDRIKGLADNGKQIKDLLVKIIQGIGELITNTLKIVVDAAVQLFQGLGKALASFSQAFDNVSWSSIGKGAAAMVVMSGSLWLISKAIKAFSEVGWDAVAKAGATLLGLATVTMILGKASANMILGAVAIAIMGAALIPMAYALKLMQDVKWEDLAKAGVALVGLAAIAALLGSAAPVFLAGAVVLAGMSIAFALFGGALWVVGKAAESAAPSLSTLFEALSKANAANLILLGPALIALGAGLAALTAGQIVKGIADFFTASPDELLNKLANINANNIMALASAVIALAGALDKLNAFDSDKLSATIGQLRKLDDIDSIAKIITASMPSAAETGQNRRVVPGIPPPAETGQNRMIGSGQSMGVTDTRTAAIQQYNQGQPSAGNNAKLEALMSELINQFKMYANRPNTIVIGNKALNEIATEMRIRNNNIR